MKLAREFAAWEEQLQRFPEELALGLAPMLRQLWAAIGNESTHHDCSGAPDGISGVAQRGRHEQMLVSQWLLATEVPMEFLRRAAMQELLFLQSATRERASSKRCILIFDAGPSQLGAPRLVHLAMLLVLERRVRRARALLQWSTLQDPSILHSSCEPSDIEALLQSRSAREPTHADVMALLQRLGQLTRTDELIWVGGRQLCQLAAQVGGQRLQVDDPLARENNELVVLLQSSHRTREVALKLPSPDVRTKLIRRPFPDQRPSPPTIRAESEDLYFSADGNRVLVRTGNTISAYLPVHAANYQPKIFKASSEASIVGCGWHDKSIMALCQRDGGLTLDWAGKCSLVLSLNRQFVVPEDGTARCRVIALGRRNLHLFVCDAEGTLFAGKQSSPSTVELKRILDNVLQIRSRNGRLVYTRAAAPGSVEFGTISSELDLGLARSVACVDPPVVVSGFDRGARMGAFAVQVTRNIAAEAGHAGGPGGLWELISDGQTTQQIELDDLDEAVACIPRYAAGVSVGKRSLSSSVVWLLLAHSLDDDCLYEVADGFRRKLQTIPTPSCTLRWDENAARAMYRDCNGRVQVISIGSKRPPFCLDASEGAKA